MAGSIKIVIKGLIANLFFTAILFFSAGRVDYVQGYMFLVANVVAMILNSISIRNNSELANERGWNNKQFHSYIFNP